jgi:hypothetical protein
MRLVCIWRHLTLRCPGFSMRGMDLLLGPGLVCEGVWKQTGHNRYKLNHVIMAWDSTGQQLIGPASLREVVTLSPDHNHFTATFTTDQYDTSGNLLFHAAGYETAERVTVDSGPPSIF